MALKFPKLLSSTLLSRQRCAQLVSSALRWCPLGEGGRAAVCEVSVPAQTHLEVCCRSVSLLFCYKFDTGWISKRKWLCTDKLRPRCAWSLILAITHDCPSLKSLFVCLWIMWNRSCGIVAIFWGPRISVSLYYLMTVIDSLCHWLDHPAACAWQKQVDHNFPWCPGSTGCVCDGIKAPGDSRQFICIMLYKLYKRLTGIFFFFFPEKIHQNLISQ